MSWWKKSLLALFTLIVLAGTPVFVYFYTHFARMIDARLSGDVFNNSSLILAAPEQITLGETDTPQDCAARLRPDGAKNADGFHHHRCAGSVVGGT